MSDEDLDKLLKQDRLIQWMEWAVMLDTLAKQVQIYIQRLLIGIKCFDVSRVKVHLLRTKQKKW